MNVSITLGLVTVCCCLSAWRGVISSFWGGPHWSWPPVNVIRMPCVFLSSGVWADLSHLLLVNRTYWKQWDVTSQIRLWKDCGSILLVVSLASFEGSQLPWLEQLCRGSPDRKLREASGQQPMTLLGQRHSDAEIINVCFIKLLSFGDRV